MLHGITPSTTTLNTKTDPYASAKAGQVTKPPRHARKIHTFWVLTPQRLGQTIKQATTRRARTHILAINSKNSPLKNQKT